LIRGIINNSFNLILWDPMCGNSGENPWLNKGKAGISL
jgi:hypothetical protein